MKSKILWLAFALVVFTSASVHSQDYLNKRHLILGMNPDPLIYIGAERIKEKSVDAPVDLFHSSSYSSPMTDGIIIILETYKNLPENLQRMIDEEPEKKDAFTITTVKDDPLTILGSGYDARGTLYGAYKVAEMLEMGSSLEDLDQLFAPKIEDRLVYLKYDVSEGVATTPPQSGRRRQNLTSKSLNELPLYGVNGVLMTDHPVAPWFPFQVSDTLTYEIEPQATDLHAIFHDIDQYGLDIYLHYPYFVFPKYSFQEIEHYLRGKKDLPGFMEYFNDYHEKRLEALFRFFPEIDGLNLGGPEATIGYISRIKSNGILKSSHRDERSLLVLENYLKIVNKVTKKYNKKTVFWTHNWGQTDVQIKALREMLYKFPDVGVLEDAHWSNMGWVNLPTMGYLSEDLQKEVGKYNDYYMMTFNDGEGLGGGVLPNAIPEPHYDVSEEIIDRNFKGIVSRIDIQDKTNLGSLFSMNEVNLIASMAPLWIPTASLDDIWKEWTERRYGKAAAHDLLPVLKSSKEIILKGYMIAGFPLLYHSRFESRSWLGQSSTDFRQLNKLLVEPGTSFLTEEDKKVIASGEYYAYQLNAEAVDIKEVRKDQKRAIKLCQQGMDIIKKLKGKLQPADYDYLLTSFNTAYYLIKGLRSATEVLYYNNLMNDNFANVKEPETKLKEAIQNVRITLGEIRAQIGTAHYDQDFYHLPAQISAYIQQVGANYEKAEL